MKIYDSDILDLLARVNGRIASDFFDIFLLEATALGAIGAMIYLSWKILPVMLNDRPLEYWTLFKPFIIAIVLSNWFPFVITLASPLNNLQVLTAGRFTNTNVEVERLIELRDKKIVEYSQKLMAREAEVADAKAQDDSSWYSFLSIDFSGIENTINGMYVYVLAKFRWVLDQFFLFVVTVFFRVCIYLIYFLQFFFRNILVAIGPLAFAMSLFPAFRDSYSQWIARFISISLYPVLAQMILSMVFLYIQYALEYEVAVYTNLLATPENFLIGAIGNATGGLTISTSSAFIVAMVVGGIAMLTIPAIANWVVQASGVGQAVGKMAKGGAVVGKAVVGAITK